MGLTTKALWIAHGSSLYFFILKRVHHATVAQDILQNIFLKVHEHLDRLQNPTKAKSWVFQIARNELANHYRGLTPNFSTIRESEHFEDFAKDGFCCFERFLEELPNNYRKVVKLVYLEGKTNVEAADRLGLSLANVKARIRRAKNMLKQRFQECCLYEMDKSGKLVGEPDCMVCNII